MEETHLSFETLLDLADGLLSLETMERAAVHLAICPACAETWHGLTRSLAALRADAEGPPAAMRAIVRGLLRAARPAYGPARFIATRQFDSSSSRAAYGLRSSPAPERQLIYSAHDYTVDLRLRGESDRWTVAGQILGPAGRGTVTLQGDTIRHTTPLNALAEFVLPPVPAGQYTLLVDMIEIGLAIPGLTVGK
jgi:hypothetical protein